jgi:hypothetical protein
VPRTWHRAALTLLPALAAAAGCASPRLDVIQTGPWFAPRPQEQVEVFARKEETRVPWGAIGIIHGVRLPVGSPKLEKQRRQARAEAAKMGADGVIIALEPAQEDRRFEATTSPEVFVSALAIKYVPDAAPRLEEP